MANHFFGRIKDKVDSRDKIFKLERLDPIRTVYLNPDSGFKMAPVWDQLSLGCCTGFGWAFAVIFDLMNNHYEQLATLGFTPSQLFLYYYERFIEGTISQDAGAQIRDGAKALAQFGICNLSLWPYDVSRFADQPTADAIANALNFKAVTYQSVDNTNKQLLVNTLIQGYPIVFGLQCYDSFEGDQANATGVIPYPDLNTEQVIGGHCMVIVGYHEGIGDDDTFVFRNSWGTQWGGHGGYGRIPSRYILDPNLCSDFWVLDLVL
jgi:C1A family cysteine protease